MTDLVAQAMAALPDALIVVDREGAIVHWSPGAERIFGYPSGKAMGGSLDLIIPERLRERHWTGFRQAVATGRSRYGPDELLAVPAQTADGRRISIEFSIAVLGQGGAISHVAALIRDVTERRTQEQELRKRLAELGG